MPADVLQRIADAIVRLEQPEVERLTREALDSLPPKDILTHGLAHGLQLIGWQFQAGEAFLPELMVACDCHQAGWSLVRPHLVINGHTPFRGRIVLGSIHGDIHTVGKDVAVPLFQSAGFDVVDLGAAVADEQFVDAVRTHRPDIVGLGTYMTATFMHTRDTVRALRDAGVREGVKIICGGPSVDAGAARRMGADDATDNAWTGVEIMKGWMAKRQLPSPTPA